MKDRFAVWGGLLVALAGAGCEPPAGTYADLPPSTNRPAAPAAATTPPTTASTPAAQSADKAAPLAGNHFVGQIRYDVSVTGTDPAMVGLVRGASETAIVVSWGAQYFRLDQDGGIYPGTIVADLAQRTWRAVGKDRDLSAPTLADLDNAPVEVRQLLPLHFRTELAPMGEEEVIAGKRCRRYRVVASGFLREGTEAELWITEDVSLRPSRFDFVHPTAAFRVTAPLPLSFPIEKGAVLQSRVTEQGVSITHRAVAITEGEPLPPTLPIGAP